MTTPALVMVAPNGARRTQYDHPALPVTVKETVRCAARCFEAGAGAIHAHVRDDEGRHILDPQRYRELIAGVAREVGLDMIVQITTEAVGRYTPPEQRALVDAVRPQAVSVALREMMPEIDTPEALKFYAWCRRKAIAVQHIVYDLADLDRLLALKSKGNVPADPLAVLLVLGRYTPGQQSAASDIVPFLQRLYAPDADGVNAMVCAFGQHEHAVLGAGLSFGLSARTGFENNILAPDGTPLADNSESVAAVCGIARALDVTPVRGDAALALLGGV